MKKITQKEYGRLSSLHDQLCNLRNNIVIRRNIDEVGEKNVHDPVYNINKAIDRLDDVLVKFYS